MSRRRARSASCWARSWARGGSARATSSDAWPGPWPWCWAWSRWQSASRAVRTVYQRRSCPTTGRSARAAHASRRGQRGLARGSWPTWGRCAARRVSNRRGHPVIDGAPRAAPRPTHPANRPREFGAPAPRRRRNSAPAHPGRGGNRATWRLAPRSRPRAIAPTRPAFARTVWGRAVAWSWRPLMHVRRSARDLGRSAATRRAGAPVRIGSMMTATGMPANIAPGRLAVLAVLAEHPALASVRARAKLLGLPCGRQIAALLFHLLPTLATQFLGVVEDVVDGLLWWGRGWLRRGVGGHDWR